jgi:hypothetical protein
VRCAFWTEVGFAVLTRVSAATGCAVTVAVDGADVTAGPVGGVPDAVAVLVIEPASMSAWVTTYVAVQVVDCCGATGAAGQVTTGAVPVPENADSATATPVRVWLPVFVTRNEYVTVCPAAVTVVGLAVFSSDRLAIALAVTVAVDGGEVTAGPAGGVPDAVAVLVIEPASMSACVTTYVAVHVVDVAGARVVTGQLTAGGVPVPVNAVSATFRLVSVTLPVFVTKKEYVTVCPAPVTIVGLADLTSVSFGVWKAGTVTTEDVLLNAPPVGGLAVTVPLSLMDPCSRSAWLTVYVAVNVAT